MLSKQQYLEKHQAKYDKSGLSKAERSKRYKQYTLSFGMKTQGVVGRSKQAEKPFRGGGVLNTSYSSFSQCTKDYATAIIDPWACARPPCVPDNITLPSFKFGVRARSTFVVGTAGLGYVYVNPYLSYSDIDYSGGFTTATFAQNVCVPSGLTNGVSGFFNDSPFVHSNFAPGTNQSRLVGCGVRARYTGTEINRSGQVLCFRTPTNNNVFGGPNPTEAQLLSFKETSTNPVDREWHYSIYRPSVAADLAYNNPVNLAGNDALLLAVFGAQPGQSFEFDYVAWFEVVGNNLPNLTRSHSDPIGMSAVSMAMPSVQPTRAPETTLRSFMKEMAYGVGTAMSFMPRLPGNLGMAQTAIGDLAAVGSYLL